MSVKYKLVLKKDLTKGAAADAKRYYASAPVSGMMDFDSICELIADRSTASDGDVALVVLGLIRAMEEACRSVVPEQSKKKIFKPTWSVNRKSSSPPAISYAP